MGNDSCTLPCCIVYKDSLQNQDAVLATEIFNELQAQGWSLRDYQIDCYSSLDRCFVYFWSPPGAGATNNFPRELAKVPVDRTATNTLLLRCKHLENPVPTVPAAHKRVAHQESERKRQFRPTIGQMQEHVLKWQRRRDILRQQNGDSDPNEQAAKKLGTELKTMKHYQTLYNNGTRYNFDFQAHANERVSELQRFIKEKQKANKDSPQDMIEDEDENAPGHGDDPPLPHPDEDEYQDT